MTSDNKKHMLQLLFIITTPKLANKASRLMKEGNIPMQYHSRGQGTASSEIMDMLGLGSIEKTVVMSMMPKSFADKILEKLHSTLHFGYPNTGVAFTVPISGGSSQMVKLLDSMQEKISDENAEKEKKRMGECEYTMIMAIVNQGYSEEVMAAAKTAGATGGTVFQSRRVGSEDTIKFWGITIQPEREMVLILSQKESKLEIMKSIGKSCGIQSEAQGVVFSLPVDNMIGLS
ncbi:MAG: transposase [Lachnospiraceae bacterium]|nr:transposase [Lachnospiraceae bacterium]